MPTTLPSDSFVHLRAEDNVVVAARHLARGDSIQTPDGEITLLNPIKLGHKTAIVDIKAGDPILKYGQTIGFASRDIPTGSHVHIHNCAARDFDRDYAFATEVPAAQEAPEPRTFRGYVRPDGRVGTRNYVAVISTVNCSASTSKYITARMTREVLRDFPNIDGVIPITHKGGCAIPFDGPDHEQLDRTLAGIARHPNVGAYLLVGLGCEVSQASHLIQSQKLVQIDGLSQPEARAKAAPMITIQEAGGIRKTVDASVKALMQLLPRAGDIRRTEAPASKLVLGLQCGASDGSSGITANPALGLATDAIVRQGGAAVLGELPEIYGGEHLLTRRAVSRSVAEALLERVRWWESYAELFGAEINNNPSPGNIEGGLTTIYEKSLGAIAKGGSTALTAVYRYAEQVTTKGFVVMDTPGYDPVSMTGIVAGGANVCVFTTGRGSVYGCKPSPCLKVASNTPLYDRMQDDMDVNAGTILDGVPLETVGAQIFEKILAVASGEETKSEIGGVGEEEFAPWSIGPLF